MTYARKYHSDYHFHAHREDCGTGPDDVFPIRESLMQNKESGVYLSQIGYVAHLDNMGHQLRRARKTRKEIQEIIKNREYPEVELYYAVEASLVRPEDYKGELELMFNEDFINKMGFSYVLAGTHWPFERRTRFEEWISDQHQHLLYLARHPLVDIVAHPWWWGWGPEGGEGKAVTEFGKCWNRQFDKVPESYHEEFAAALIKNGTAVEINFIGTLIEDIMPPEIRKPYVKYLDLLNRNGVTFALGSDTRAEILPCHYEPAWEIMDQLGIDPEKLWHPSASKTWRRNRPEWRKNHIGCGV